MRRVAILVENLPVPLDRRVWQEALALRDAGWSVTVIGPRGAGEMRALHEHRDGIEVMRYPQRAATGLGGYLIEYLPSMLFTWAWLVRARLAGPIQVIHACNPPDLFWLFGWLGRLWGSQFVYDQHDANPELSVTKFGTTSAKGRALHALTCWLERRSYRAAALVVAPNASYAEIARRRGGVGLNRLIIVRNAPDVAAYRRLAADQRPDPHRVGYVGVMGSQDGLDMLLDAWRTVVATEGLADAHLELVGDGEARANLERQAKELGIAHAISFHGYQRPGVFVPILARCALCMSPDPPTPFNDVSTMVKVIDYLAIGRCIVAFDLRETRLAAGDAAEIVHAPTFDALAHTLIALMQDPERAHRRAAVTPSRVADLQLDWQVSAARLVAGYDRLAPVDPSDPPSDGSADGRPTPR